MNRMINISEEVVRTNLINLRQLVFEVTEKCNLRCGYCGLSDLYKSYTVREDRDLPFQRAKSMIDYLLKLWRDNHNVDTVFPVIVSFYGGEPLMNMPLIRKIIEYLEQSKIKERSFRYSMTTNGMLLDKCMDYLVEKKFNILISLDGDENSNSYRVDHFGRNSFKKVFTNAKLLQIKFPEYFNKYVQFASVLHNRNDVEPIYDFFETNFDKETPRISPLSDVGVCENKKGEFRKMYKNKTASFYKSKNCETLEKKYFLETPRGYSLSRYLYNLSGNIYYNYNQLMVSKLVNDMISTGTCSPFSKKLFLSVSGRILPCERIDHDFGLGYVHDDFVELDYNHVADRHNHLLSKLVHQCYSCGHKKLCPECIYFIDDIRNRTSQCLSFCTEDKAEEERQGIFDYLRQNPHYYEKVLNEVGFSK